MGEAKRRAERRREAREAGQPEPQYVGVVRKVRDLHLVVTKETADKLTAEYELFKQRHPDMGGQMTEGEYAATLFTLALDREEELRVAAEQEAELRDRLVLTPQEALAERPTLVSA